ncbi:MAG: 4-hydroxy-tetrahydrodipicolinate reductase [Burkholderiales bacterium]|jgi:4-hydroxy-tetrahydrodipicolinate reductase
MEIINVVVAGSSGKMGRSLIRLISADANVRLAAALDHPSSPALGQDSGASCGQPNGVMISGDIEGALNGADVLIDFTRPEGTMEHMKHCITSGVNMVVGTTGFSQDQKSMIEKASEKIAIVMAPNMSVGVNVVLGLLKIGARALNEGYDIEVVESHHRNKVDAPSGTALKMGEVVAESLGWDLNECAIFSREGNTGVRPDSKIGFSTIRGGDIVGEHTVMFAGEGERVEISHKATDRANFSAGAIRATKFLKGKSSGLYNMSDVLGLS